MPDHVSTPDGRPLEILTGGADYGFPLLFHGGTPSAAVPYDAMSRAAEQAGLRLVTWSRPGYGASPPRPAGATPVLADDVADGVAILDALGLGDFVTLGWSGGGPRALACAALLPDRCRAAVSLAGVAPFDAEGLDWTAGMGAENVRDFELAARGREAFLPLGEEEAAALAVLTADQLVEGLGDLTDEVDAAALTGAFADYLAASFRHAVTQGSPGLVEDTLQAMRPWGFDVRDIGVPVAVWQGSHDRMVPFSHGQWLASRIPGARVHLFDDEGHLSLVHRMPEMFAELRELAGLDR
jgi:pimeloyl-ACP methyl ester carboxylesterase